MAHATLQLALLICFCVVLAHASSGDRSQDFLNCVAGCQMTGCIGRFCQTVCPHHHSTHQPEFPLRLWRWSCDDDCRYHCMHSIEHFKAQQGIPPEKYYGKWPFRRVLGMQEIASAAFSVLNLLAHVHCMSRFRRHLSSSSSHRSYPYSWLWLTWSTLSVNAWFWSVIFHGRDTHITERFDYLSAISVVLFGLVTATTRTLGVQRLHRQLLTLALVAAFYLQHCHHMLFVEFDYGYNMKVCIGVGALGAVIWGMFCFAGQHPARGVILAFMACIYSAMAFEVLDFPPLWGLVDAHSVWHLLTAPLVYLWYCFVHMDVVHLAKRSRSKE